MKPYYVKEALGNWYLCDGDDDRVIALCSHSVDANFLLHAVQILVEITEDKKES